MLKEKFESNLKSRFPAEDCEKIIQLFEARQSLEEISVDQFMALFRVDPRS